METKKLPKTLEEIQKQIWEKRNKEDEIRARKYQCRFCMDGKFQYTFTELYAHIEEIHKYRKNPITGKLEKLKEVK